MSKSQETKDNFVELRAKGMTLANIAKELDIAYNTAVKWNKELEGEVDVARAFKLEEMKEKYRMTREKRIEIYGERLLAIQDELAKRDLSDVPTNKLLEMMQKCEKALDAEIPELEFRTDEEIKEMKKDKEFLASHTTFIGDLVSR